MERKVKTINKPEVADLAGEKVMIDFISGKYFLLKGVANDIWDMLDDGITIKSIEDKLLKEYEVDETTCRLEVNRFLDELVEKGFIEIV